MAPETESAERAPSGAAEEALGGRGSPAWTARFLFYVNAGVWTALGLATLWAGFNGSAGMAGLILAGLMLGNAVIMAWLGWRLAQQRRRYYYAALSWLFVNILLTVTDEFGLLDGLTMLLDLILVALLVVARAHFLPERRP